MSTRSPEGPSAGMEGVTTDAFPDATLPLQEGAKEMLQTYLDMPIPPTEQCSTRGQDFVRRAVPPVLRERIRRIATSLMRPIATRKVREMKDRNDVKLHLGSGLNYKAGWINIDLVPVRVDLPWDLARGIPFDEDTVDAIFHEHLQEHLTLKQAYELARESWRVLRPGGVLRVGVPDAGQAVQSYAGNWDDAWAQSAPTGMVAIQRLFYEHGHRSMYDGQTLSLLLRAAGFREVERCRFGEGRLKPNDDTPARREGTLYVEAIKS